MPNDVKRISEQGNTLFVFRQDGTTDMFKSTSGGYWIPPQTTTFDIRYLTRVGNLILANRPDGLTFFYLTIGNNFIPDTALSGPIPPPTPNPGDTSTKQALVNWMVAHIGHYAYSQAYGRLTPDTSGFSDCSALVWYCYKMVTGNTNAMPLVNNNTYTGTEAKQGTVVIPATTANSVDESVMQLGDLVFFDWGSNGVTSTWDHVEMYMGNNQTIGHGGGYGPKIKNLQNNVSYAIRVQVNRYL